MSATVYPTGTTIYEPENCWNGYTILQIRTGGGAVLVDMNGRTVKKWPALKAFPTANKILPGGYIMGGSAPRSMKHSFQDSVDLVQMDWNGKTVWKFTGYELIKDPRFKPRWMARQHHDYQRENNPVGYYAPGMEPKAENSRTLMLCHTNTYNRDISEKRLLDDAFIEIDWNGKILWEWKFSDHFDELGFSEVAKNTIARNPNMVQSGGGMGDWMHINSCSYCGPNKWHDAGDERFHPDNIVWSSRISNILGVTDRKTGKIVWKVGPDYTATEALRNLKQIIGPHHFHIIPRGLPGEGNMLVYDNGGWAGYGAPNEGSPTGYQAALRDYTRVIEFDPNTLEIVWQYPKPATGPHAMISRYSVYSPLMSSCQRLLNGNTLISEGNFGRVFEVNPECEVVWEFVSPFHDRTGNRSGIYRAYRVPYEWVPQAEPKSEVAVPRIDNTQFRVPGAAGPAPRRRAAGKVTDIEADGQFCATPGEGI